MAFDHRQHLEIETPEHVVLDYEIAGLGSRALAALADTGILAATLLAMLLLGFRLQAQFPSLPIMAVAVALYFATLWGYFTLFEGFREGQTPGKKWLGIRVIRDTGHGVTFRDAAIRNLLRLADFLPPPYLIGALVVAIHPRGKRLGDLVAGTVVVRDRPAESGYALSGAALATSASSDLLGAPLLTDEEYQVLREYAARAPQLAPLTRHNLAARLVDRFADRIPRHEEAEAFLASVLRDETARRQGRFASRPRVADGASAPGGRAAIGVAARLVARQESRWREFEQMASRAARRGLDSLGAAELPDFAARYREVAADLARARTYRADPLVLARLERLAAAGHNLLYRGERRTLAQLGRFIAVEAPAAVVEARRVVLVAFLAFAVPAAAGYAALREQPGMAQEVLPAVLLDRADEGVAHKAQGRGYAEADPGDRPFVASRIITNNIGVAFTCLAGGIFLGVGSLLALAFNGLLIGAVSAHYQNVGLLDFLWTFVAGHGVLELFAIFCAGAAGFLLGMSMVRPGNVSRRDALVLNGRTALSLIGFTVILLLVAGLIEGFVSTSTASPAAKVGVSLASAVGLVAYLAMGARRRFGVARLADRLAATTP
jgi:uncharacterized membrane protein SpoIIM required for sporulation/uncharacterized RDD family membrane protein YckC